MDRNRRGASIRMAEPFVRTCWRTSSKGRRAVIEDQTDHLTEVRVELLKCLGLAVGARQTWYVANVETGVGAALNDGSVGGVSAGTATFRHGTNGTP